MRVEKECLKENLSNHSCLQAMKAMKAMKATCTLHVGMHGQTSVDGQHIDVGSGCCMG